MNRLLIKEKVIVWLALIIEDADEYNNVKIMGTFADNDVYPVVTCAINNEKPLLNMYSGTVDYDFVNDSRKVIYKSLFNIQLNIYADIDDESNRISEIIVDKIRERKHTLLVSDEIIVEEIRDDIMLGDAKPVDLSGVKKFMCQVIVPIKLYEVKTITRS